MANRVTMTICGMEYTLVAEEDAAYMEKVGAMVDGEMRQLMDGAHMSRDNAAVLAAVNLADELCKAQENADNLRRQLKTYLDEASRAKNEAAELRRKLFKRHILRAVRRGHSDRKFNLAIFQRPLFLRIA